MLKRLHLQNFTVFADADFEFSPGLNVLVGTNGTGKTRVLKIAYAITNAVSVVSREKGVRSYWNYLFGTHITDIFIPGNLGALVQLNAADSTVNLSFGKEGQSSAAFQLKTSNQQEVSSGVFEGELIPEPSLFIPTKEILEFLLFDYQ